MLIQLHSSANSHELADKELRRKKIGRDGHQTGFLFTPTPLKPELSGVGVYPSKFGKNLIWGYNRNIMEVKEFQNKIIEFLSKWDEKRKTNPNEEQVFIHLVEEIGELARQYVNKESRKDKYNEEEFKNAIGDILMQCVKVAHLRGLDIEETVLKIIEKEQKLLK